MEYQDILFECKDHIATLTLNRPHVRNAISDETIINEVVDACSRVQDDESIKALIITGKGTAFCAGGNVKAMQQGSGMFAGDPVQVHQNYRKGIQRIPLAIHRLDVPTIAAVNGPAIGAGCDLACMCDIRIASESARFGETFASLGIVPGDGGAFFLPRVVGLSKAMELAFTCRVIDAHEAERIGMVSEVVAPDALLARCMDLALEIARQPSRTLRLTKRLFSLSHGKSLEETLEISAAYQALCHHTAEHHTAIEAAISRLVKTPRKG